MVIRIKPEKPAAPRDKQLWDETVQESRIIAAVRSTETLEQALRSPVRIVYLLFGNPMNIAGMIASVRERGKLPLVNADLLQGFRAMHLLLSILRTVAQRASSRHIMRRCGPRALAD